MYSYSEEKVKSALNTCSAYSNGGTVPTGVAELCIQLNDSDHSKWSLVVQAMRENLTGAQYRNWLALVVADVEGQIGSTRLPSLVKRIATSVNYDGEKYVYGTSSAPKPKRSQAASILTALKRAQKETNKVVRMGLLASIKGLTDSDKLALVENKFDEVVVSALINQYEKEDKEYAESLKRKEAEKEVKERVSALKELFAQTDYWVENLSLLKTISDIVFETVEVHAGKAE